MTIFFNMKEVTMQISEKQVDNLEDKNQLSKNRKW